MQASLKQQFVLMMVVLVQAVHVAQARQQYLLVLDAGSTGTRLNAFRFKVDAAHSTGLRLLSLNEEKVTPGLSAFANFPSRLRAPLRRLLQFAEQKVPVGFHSNTTVIVRATAGLRLLTPAARRRVVKAVEEELRSSKFRVPPQAAVRVISGTEEAVFGWVAVNFLMDTFDKPLSETYGMLDMGGGSAQITFVQPEGGAHGDNRVLFRTVHGKEYPLHQHSYLGLGLSAATLQLLGHSEDSDDSSYESACVHPSYKGSFKFGMIAVNVSGAASPEGAERFTACSNASQRTLRLHHVHSPVGVQDAKFVAVSSFFYITETLYRAHPDWAIRAPAQFPVSYFTQAAKRVCANPPTDGKYKSYLCASLTYAQSLLLDGYRFSPNQSLLITNEIKGYSASWPLGLAIHHLTCNKRGGNNSCLGSKTQTSTDFGAVLLSALHLLPLLMAAALGF